MENTKYIELKEHLKNVLKTAKKLGLIVQPGGGYTMGYDINNLPPYPVGLFGALSIVEGPGARCKLGLTFDETESLESGFNGCMPNAKNKKKKKRATFQPDIELMKIGAELTLLVHKPRGYDRIRGSVWDNMVDDLPSASAPSFAAYPDDNPKALKKTAQPGVSFGTAEYIGSASTTSMTVSYSGTFGGGKTAKKMSEKAKKLEDMLVGVEAKAAQIAPKNKEKLLEEIVHYANEIANNHGEPLKLPAQEGWEVPTHGTNPNGEQLLDFFEGTDEEEG